MALGEDQRRIEVAEAIDTALAGETVAVQVSRRANIDPGCARQAFADPAWLGSPVAEGAQPGWRRIATDLELPVRDGSGPAVRKAAMIDIGPCGLSDQPLMVPIAWRSATLAPLFPVFAGRLEVRRSSLTLIGRYAPPLGGFGLLIDRSLLHFVAGRTAQAFLARIESHCREPSALIGE